MASVPESLNPAQMAAVHHTSGPCLVLAGAGSGKTRVITAKIAHLLGRGVPAAEIAAITFTNKAAAEMRERARAMVGGKVAKPLVISTFHSLGVRMLREDGERLGLKPQFTIFDADDVLAQLREAGGTTDAALARRWQWQISLWKNAGLDAAGADAAAQDADARLAARVFARYQERLAAFQAVDFDDLLGLPLALLRRDDEARARWQNAFAHVLVDEVQDTNAVQYELLKMLVSGDDPLRRGRFTAVGDDDQSIYGWRGATLDNLARLQSDWPTLKLIPLEQNYRSTGAILRAANHVIAANPKLYEKTLWSDLGEGDPVRRLDCDHEEHEADRAVAFIQSLRGGGAAWSEFAVLYRANHQARVLEQKLRAAQIPYRVSGGQSLFDRAEIKDLCAWLRLVVNPDDDPAFLRAATTPRRGIGATTLDRLGRYATQWKISLFEALFKDALTGVVGAKAAALLQEFGREVNALAHDASRTDGQEEVQALLDRWLQSIGYQQHLRDAEESERLADARWRNVVDFTGWIARRCGGVVAREGGMVQESERQTLTQVAQTISVILSIAERGGEPDVVTLSTLHAAKGLEWPHVMLAGVNEGLLPFCSEGETLTPERLHEERRLMYVGITRARRSLAVSTLRRRKRGREAVAAMPSRFVAEMKLDEAVAREDARERLKRLRAELAARAAATG